MRRRIILADSNIVKEVSRARARYNKLLSYERRRNRMLQTHIDSLLHELASLYRRLENADRHTSALLKFAQTNTPLLQHS